MTDNPRIAAMEAREARRKRLQHIGNICIALGLSISIGYVSWHAVERVIAAVGGQ